METVEFVIESPQVASRNYTYFEWGTCQSGANKTSDVLRMCYNSVVIYSHAPCFFRARIIPGGLATAAPRASGSFIVDIEQEARDNFDFGWATVPGLDEARPADVHEKVTVKLHVHCVRLGGNVEAWMGS